METSIHNECDTLFFSMATIFINAPPSCLEFCPAFPWIFVVGTYSLHTSEHGEETGEQSRSGSLQMLRLAEDKTMYSSLSLGLC